MEERGDPFELNEDAYVGLTSLRKRIESGPDLPFESPFFWGDFFVTGCGWCSGGGKVVTLRSDSIVDMAEGVVQVKTVTEKFNECKFEEAIDILRNAVPKLDGL